MYTISPRGRIQKIHVFFQDINTREATTRSPELTVEQKAEILQQVNHALEQNARHDPKHEVLRLAMTSGLDQYLKDPKVVLQMIQYAQDTGKSIRLIIALSKRYATLSKDPTYYSELARIEESVNGDKDDITGKYHTYLDQIKVTVQNRVR